MIVVDRYVAEMMAVGAWRVNSAYNNRRLLVGWEAFLDGRPPSRELFVRWLGRAKSPAYKRRCWSVVRGFARWQVEHGLADDDFTLKVKAPPVPRPAPRPVPMEQVDKLVRASGDDLRLIAIVLVMAWEGLRRAEVAQLELGDVDLTNLSLMVSAGKGGQRRWVPLSRATADAITCYLDEERGWSPGPLFMSRKRWGRGVAPSHIGELVRLLMYDAGIKRGRLDGKSAHALRHTAATETLIASGGDILAVRDLLGHASIRTTTAYLSATAPARLRQVMNMREGAHD